MFFAVTIACLFLLDTPDMTYRSGWEYDVPFAPHAEYNASVPTPDSLLGFPHGSKAASPEQIETCIRAWSETSDRVVLKEYARSYEDRPLFVLTISTPENLAKLDAIQKDILALSDPRKTSPGKAESIIGQLPAIAWLAYSIHGNESSGADAALAVIYHLIADQSDTTKELLSDMVIFIDPMMNPDGRARFHKKMQEQRGASPNFDSQSLSHNGEWPGGRTNHYYFDLNRDFILGVNPETRGRVKLVNSWYPQLLIDAHEMGALGTYLFSPPREPINLHIPPKNRKWGKVFGRDQARAFDQHGWTYYTGEWNEEWYPGYSFWCAYRGTQAILYEQARIHEDAIKHPDGTYHSYRESVHHQFQSSFANLATLKTHSKEMWHDFWNDRMEVLAKDSVYHNRTWVIAPTANLTRMRSFLERLDLQGFEYYVATEALGPKDCIDQLGRVKKINVEKGAVLIPNLQPEARLLGTMMEFDPRLSDEVLKKERKELLSHGRSLMYDTTGWSLTMLFDLKAWEMKEALPDQVKRLESVVDWVNSQVAKPSGTQHNSNVIAWVYPGRDDSSLRLAARAMEKGVQVRVASKDFEFDGTTYSRGSLLVLKGDNPGLNVPDMLEEENESRIKWASVYSGWGEGDLPDLGGRYFALLRRPQIAMVGHGSVSSYDFGSLWHSLDHNLGIRHSHLRESQLARTDLRRYNVLVLPQRYGNLPKANYSSVLDWVRQGGTLVAIGNSASGLLKANPKELKSKCLEDALEDLDRFEIDLHRKWLGHQALNQPVGSIWEHGQDVKADYPWAGFAKRPKKDELERRDRWDRIFMPQGVILAANVDQEHWLTSGCGEILPIMYARGPVLLSDQEVPLRFGVLESQKQKAENRKSESQVAKKKERSGWAALPKGQTIRMRMSGLLWPEAARRIANSAWAVREPLGRGQIIFLASSPNFRASTYGPNRVFLNAVILGPGLGARPVLSLD